MNCVYTALNNHLRALGEPQYQNVFKEYQLRKKIVHPNLFEYTFAGVVPWLYWHMLYVHNALSKNRIEMKIERHYVPLLELFDEATNAQKLIMYETKYWGAQMEEISLAPAVYCLLNEQHAFFAKEIPDTPGTRILMAIQLVHYEKDK